MEYVFYCATAIILASAGLELRAATATLENDPKKEKDDASEVE